MRVNVTIFLIDVINHYCITYNSFTDKVKPLANTGSLLFTLIYNFMKGIHDNYLNDCRPLQGTGEKCITLYDPVPIWYALNRTSWTTSLIKDICVESY